VVLASGEVREVVARWPVARHGIPRWGAQHREDEHTGYGSTARGAVVDCAAIYVWEVAEILAPGEPTRAEAVAAERERCARLCDEVARERGERLRALESEGISPHDPARLALVVAITDAERCAAKIRAGGV
jgi:hypothetical protein